MDDFHQIPGVLAQNRIVDAMDAASVIKNWLINLAKSARRLHIKSADSFAFVAFLFVSSNLLAQSPLVEVATEPRLANTAVHGPRLSQANPQNPQKPEIVEPERMQQPKNEEQTKTEAPSRKSDATKQATNFLPPQRPIGQVNIDLRTKPKKGKNSVPDNLAEQTMGQSHVVQASSSAEMQGDLVFTMSRNHDELFAYHPLYFEEANLERYGRTCGQLQPALSSLRFFATIPALPYAMTVRHPSKTYITQWPYEAGWGAPKVKEFQPLEPKPSLVQAGAITGLLFVLP